MGRRALRCLAVFVGLLSFDAPISWAQQADGAAAPSKAVEQRLADLEKRIDLILSQLEELRRGPVDPPPSSVTPEDFRTVVTATSTPISREAPAVVVQPAYLGIHVQAEGGGRLAVLDVAADSPAAKAGILPADVLRQVDGQGISQAESLRELIRAKSPGDKLKFALWRRERPLEVNVVLEAASKPLSAAGQAALRGLSTSDADEGLRITRMFGTSAASEAGLRQGDIIAKVDGVAVAAGQRLSDLIGEKQPGNTVSLTVKRDDKELTIDVPLPADESDAALYGRDGRVMPRWKKDLYRLAVIPIDYSDLEHNAKITPEEWEKALFSRGQFSDKNVTGQRVYGSMNDYYAEQSYGNFRVEGKVFEHIKVERKRADYANDSPTGGQGSRNTRLLTETIDKLLERDGKEALTDFDGLCFIYSGGRLQSANRGSLYWPHRSSVTHQGKRWAYFITSEGGGSQMGGSQRGELPMSSISVFAHEFGHMLGLPDLYARPEQPGSEGVGVWCAMSQQNNNGRPQHFGAWSKEQLGWLKPTVIDPAVKQKLILAGVEDSPQECFKVLIRADGSEYLLLENRRKSGFDADLPAAGMLIWHVVDGKPLLEESHGVLGPGGPRSFLGSVPYPSKSNTAFTPFTTPSSKPQKGAGSQVHITNIYRWPDGRISFYVGYDYL